MARTYPRLNQPLLLVADAVHAKLSPTLQTLWPVTRIANQFILVGLSGKKGSGKTSVANIIQQMKIPNVRVIQLGFATILKNAVEQFLSPEIRIHPPGNTDQEFKNALSGYVAADGTPMTIRQLYCWLGMAAREMNSNFWVQAFHNQLVDELVDHISLSSSLKPLVVLIPDVRFQNELEYLEQNNALVARMPLPPGYDSTLLEHESETQLDNYDRFYCDYDMVHRGWEGPECLLTIATNLLCNVVGVLTFRRKNSQNLS